MKLRALVNGKDFKARQAAYFKLSPADRDAEDTKRKEEQAKQEIEETAEIEQLRSIVPEKDWPK